MTLRPYNYHTGSCVCVCVCLVEEQKKHLFVSLHLEVTWSELDQMAGGMG